MLNKPCVNNLNLLTLLKWLTAPSSGIGVTLNVTFDATVNVKSPTRPGSYVDTIMV